MSYKSNGVGFIMLKLENFGISNESYIRQSGELHKELTAIVAEYQQNTQMTNNEIIARISNCVKKHTGIRMEYILVDESAEPDHVFSVAVTSLVKNGYFSVPLHEKYIRSFFDGDLQIVVDNAKCKLSGQIMDFPLNKLYMGHTSISKLQPEYVASVIIHEVGHVYASVAFVTSVKRGSEAISQTVREIYNEPDISVRKLIISDSDFLKNSNTKLTDEELNVLVRADKENLEIVLANYATDEMKFKDKTSSIYSLRDFEQFADMFVVAHGGAVAHARFLDELYQRDYGKDFFSRLKSKLSWILSGHDWTLIQIYAGTTTIADYDDDYDRLKTVRYRLVEDLKRLNFKNKDLTKSVLDEIKEIDTILAKHKNERSRHVKLFEKRSSIGKVLKKQTDRAKALEELIYNDLFVKSAKLLQHS